MGEARSAERPGANSTSLKYGVSCAANRPDTRGIVMANMLDPEVLGAEPAEPLDWVGTDRFEVLRCIGRGGMGTVYEARDREHKRRVALKTLRHFDAASLYRFKQEFRTLANVSHPNLVRLHEFLVAEGDRAFFSMELVRGTDFVSHSQKAGSVPRIDDSTMGRALGDHSLVRKATHSPRSDRSSSQAPPDVIRPSSPADFDRLLPALRQLVEGLHALHVAGKLHRDVKPSNVLVTPEGRVVVLDFGVATDLPRAGHGQLVDEGQMVGTAHYMAPEQAMGDAPTPAADWYSVGVILYEALVGFVPFTGSVTAVISAKNTEAA